MSGRQGLEKKKRKKGGLLFILCTEDYAESKEGAIFLTYTWRQR